MNIDHIGIVVKSIEKGISHWKEVFHYTQKTHIVTNTRQKVKVVFLEKENSTLIKLIEPVDETSSVYIFMKKGGGLHHLCFKCDDLSEKIIELNNLGLRTLVAPEPGEAFNSKDIAFLYAKNGLNIELIDTNEKARIID